MLNEHVTASCGGSLARISTSGVPVYYSSTSSHICLPTCIAIDLHFPVVTIQTQTLTQIQGSTTLMSATFTIHPGPFQTTATSDANFRVPVLILKKNSNSSSNPSASTIPAGAGSSMSVGTKVAIAMSVFLAVCILPTAIILLVRKCRSTPRNTTT